jgi:hypothetical protein
MLGLPSSQLVHSARLPRPSNALKPRTLPTASLAQPAALHLDTPCHARAACDPAHQPAGADFFVFVSDTGSPKNPKRF